MMLLDPRDGDSEDDVAAPKARSFLAIAGGMLVEISPLKVLAAFALLVIGPNLALGVAPLVVSAWFSSVSAEVQAATTLGSLIVFVLLIAAALATWRPLFSVLESNFWSLNSLIVQPGYVLCREILRHAMARWRLDEGSADPNMHIVAEIGAGAFVIAACTTAIWFTWPHTRWIGEPADLRDHVRLVVPALANALVIVSAYAACAALVWSLADVTTPPPVGLGETAMPIDGARTWRVAQLSDVHVVGERFGFRLEIGRRGPRGNDRFHATLDRLAAAHAANPIDIVLFSGDMTDAGRSAEWIEFLDALTAHPELQAISIMIPGNHDVNIIDRSNPARLDLPWSSAKQIRRLRALSAMESVQGDRVTIEIDGVRKTLRAHVDEHAPKLRRLASTADHADARLADVVWRAGFPQVLAPQSPDGLGVILLDTNADTHFSFTNALGLLPAGQAIGLERVLRAYPSAGWIIAMHHHITEYPHLRSPFAIRIGTALINGSWVIRQFKRHAARVLVMHGHRHVDWMGRCGPLRIISAPSPVMGVAEGRASYFLIHNLQLVGGKLELLAPEKVHVPAKETQAGPFSAPIPVLSAQS